MEGGISYLPHSWMFQSRIIYIVRWDEIKHLMKTSFGLYSNWSCRGLSRRTDKNRTFLPQTLKDQIHLAGISDNLQSITFYYLPSFNPSTPCNWCEVYQLWYLLLFSHGQTLWVCCIMSRSCDQSSWCFATIRGSVLLHHMQMIFWTSKLLQLRTD